MSENGSRVVTIKWHSGQVSRAIKGATSFELYLLSSLPTLPSRSFKGEWSASEKKTSAHKTFAICIIKWARKTLLITHLVWSMLKNEFFGGLTMGRSQKPDYKWAHCRGLNGILSLNYSSPQPLRFTPSRVTSDCLGLRSVPTSI